MIINSIIIKKDILWYNLVRRRDMNEKYEGFLNNAKKLKEKFDNSFIIWFFGIRDFN